MLVTLLILIFIRPFISSPAFPYINFIYSILLFSFLVIWIIAKGVHLDKIKPIKYPLMLFVLALFISLVFSQDKIISMKELYKYITGLLLLLTSVSLTHKHRDRTILCLVIAGFFIGLLAIYQYFFGFQRLLAYIAKQGITDPFILDYVSRKRVFFPFVTPNVLGGYLAMIIPLALTYKERISLIIPLSFALLLTRSVGGLLSLFFGLAIYFYLQGKFGKKRVIFLFGLLITIVFVLIVRSSTPKQHVQPIFSTIMRLSYWQDTLGIIKAHVFSGVGLGNFNLTYSRFAHNSYLQIWAEMGILGIISFFWFIAALSKSAFSNAGRVAQDSRAPCLIAAYTVFLVHNFVDFTFFLPEVTMVWWVISGLMLCKDGNKYPATLPPSSRALSIDI